MKWRRMIEIPDEQVQAIASRLNLNELLVRIALNRGLLEDQVRIVLNDINEGIISPYLLTNAERAAEVIASYATNRDAEIWIFADYDVDGITSGYIMKSAIQECAVCFVEVYYPERAEGYGLSIKFCEKLVEANKEDPKDILVITVDNGITKVKEVEYLKNNCIEVIVTDHHKAKYKTPDCIIVDPHNNGESDTFKHLAGCGVAFKVAEIFQDIMVSKYNEKMIPNHNMQKYVFAVALGTVADMMPFSVENIAFIKYGFQQMNNAKTCPASIQTFKKYISKDEISATDISWDLAPKINACGRMGNVNLAASLFFEDGHLDSIWNSMILLHEQSKAERTTAEAEFKKMNFDGDNICIIDATNYTEGIAGIIANKVVEHFGKPAIMLHGDGVLKGSVRSIDGIGMHAILEEEFQKGNIIEFGGHDGAAGLKVKKEKIEDLRASLNERLEGVSTVTIKDDEELIVDDFIEMKQVNERTLKILNELPYSRSFSEPVLSLAYVTVVKAEPVKSNPANLWLTITDGKNQMKLKANNLSERYTLLGTPTCVHLAGNVKYNFMYGKGKDYSKITFEIIDIMKADEE